MTSLRAIVAIAIVAGGVGLGAQGASTWQEWSASESQRIVKSTVETGRIAGGRRLLNTERARSYKLRAAWLTPDVVQAAARLHQLRSRLAPAVIESFITDLLRPGETAVMIEIDPDEGSGVIPLDWEAFLQPKEAPDRGIAGRNTPAFGDAKLLSEGFPRNYDYDRFWMVFPLKGPRGPLFLETDEEAELVVRIYGREGRVRWLISPSLRRQSPQAN